MELFSDEYYMNEALKQAQIAFEEGEIPVGAVIVSKNRIIARAYNQTEKLNDVTAHAEMIAITSAANYLGAKYLPECKLYVTLEPCTMCAGAIAHVKLRRLYYAAEDPKGGAVDNGVRFFDQPTCHHAPEVIGGVAASRAAEMLRKFFAERR